MRVWRFPVGRKKSLRCVAYSALVRQAKEREPANETQGACLALLDQFYSLLLLDRQELSRRIGVVVIAMEVPLPLRSLSWRSNWLPVIIVTSAKVTKFAA